MVVLSGALLTSCRTDLDVRNMDQHVELDYGIALPVGDMRITLADMLGLAGATTYLSFEEDGLLTFRDTFHITRSYRNVEITDYFADVDSNFLIQPKLGGAPVIATPLAPLSQVLDFPVVARFDMFNNTNIERIDSIDVLHTNFVSTIQPVALDGFQWDWVDAVEVVLSDQFTRPAGNILPVYTRALDSEINDFGYEIPIDIDQFTLSFMKDRHARPDLHTNVVDSVGMTLRFHITVPQGQMIPLSAQSAFRYTFHLTLLDYNAIWGRFVPSGDMETEREEDIASQWPAWNDLKRMRLPFSDPEVDLRISTKIAGNLEVGGEYLYVISNEQPNEPVYALFDGSRQLHDIWADPQKTLSVDRSTIGDSVTNSIKFNKTESRGQLDKLFALRPDRIGYKFRVTMYQPEQPPYQIRLTKDNNIRIAAHVKAPFSFNPGLEIEYSDTLKSHISAFSLDSIIRSDAVDIQSAKVKLVLTIHNSLPSELTGHFRFLDENMQPVMVRNKKGELVPFRIIEGDSIRILPPSYSRQNGQTLATAEESRIVLSLEQEHYDAIERIRNVVFTASFNDEQLRQVAEKNSNLGIYPIRFTDDTSVKVSIGISGKLKATVDLGELINGDDNDNDDDNHNDEEGGAL